MALSFDRFSNLDLFESSEPIHKDNLARGSLSLSELSQLSSSQIVFALSAKFSPEDQVLSFQRPKVKPKRTRKAIVLNVAGG